MSFYNLIRQVCLPPEFTTDEVVVDPKNDDIFGSRVYFSHKLQKERIDVNSVYHNEKPDAEKFQFLLDYPKRKPNECFEFLEIWYEVKYAKGTAK